nr:dehydrogenase [Saprospiraceae bacterium]
MIKSHNLKSFTFVLLVFIAMFSCSTKENKATLSLRKNMTISMIGNNLCSRLLNYDMFEPMLQTYFPDSTILVRNFCRAGDTPGFRPHSGRNLPWAFPGAEAFHTEFANPSNSQGTFAYPDEWLSKYQTDVILAFFGYSEALESLDSLENLK